MAQSVLRSTHRHLAAELWSSARSQRPVRAISARHPAFTLADAYKVQRELRAMELADGAALVGYKIGATSEAIQKMFKIDHPDFGYLTDRMLLPEGACLDPHRFISPKVEGEVAFRMEADLSGESVTAIDVLKATAEVFPALEVLDSRFANWEIRLVDTVADNASSALAVLGQGVSPRGIDLAAESLVFETGGSRQTARGSAVLGHPAESVARLVQLLAPFGDGIRAGDIVLSGAWAAAVDLSPGCVAKASFDSIGTVSLRMSRNGGA
ncbi:fumarylacetoacetate hydrolase family protein [Actinomadura sp. 7K507]|uniref:2-keto-4-pentenoate hydratase n=1 Tax=Actinomadura sp. 7K507 TaxID=2530365 RepID=UPI001047EED3|nr:fumarylacetoacetate hydrolase family protein [Actinomadura sp. 7K507]TDC86430.1 hypothetical protein E1285_23295 [Actinomadura sp. 7K507]